MGDQTVGTILDSVFEHGEISAAIFPVDEIERTITMLAIECFRISPLVTGEIGTIQILTESVISGNMAYGLFHDHFSIQQLRIETPTHPHRFGQKNLETRLRNFRKDRSAIGRPLSQIRNSDPI